MAKNKVPALAASVADRKEIPALFTGIWIPAAVFRFTHLDSYDREILGCINGFNNGGKKFISVSYLSRLMNADRSHVSRRVAKLKKDGLLKVVDYNSARGSCNALVLTDKARGMDLNDYEDELQPPNDKGSSGGCSSDAHPVAETHTPVAETHTDNKLYKSSSSKRDSVTKSDSDFQVEGLEIVLAWIFVQLEKLGYDLSDDDRVYVDGKVMACRQRYPLSDRADVFSYLDVGLKKRIGIFRRSSRNAAARDRVSDAVVGQLDAQAAVIDQHTGNMQPRDRFDTSWADGVELLESEL